VMPTVGSRCAPPGASYAGPSLGQLLSRRNRRPKADSPPTWRSESSPAYCRWTAGPDITAPKLVVMENTVPDARASYVVESGRASNSDHLLLAAGFTHDEICL